MKKHSRISTFDCPHCGGQVKSTAKSCPHCGSDHETGWSENAELEHESEDEFDYDEFIEREFPNHADTTQGTSRKINWTKLTVILLLISMILSALMLF